MRKSRLRARIEAQSYDKENRHQASHNECYIYYTFETLAPPTYTLTSGDKQEVKPGSDATFVSSAPFNKFQKVLVDDVEVDKDNYTVVEGSTKVTLKAGFLKTLTPGKHTIEIVSNDGSVSGEFTVISVIDEIVATNVTLPKAGEKPVTTCTIPGGVNYALRDLVWFVSDDPITTREELDAATEVSGTDVFQEGKYYTFAISMVAKEYYVFADTPTATINGDSAYYTRPGSEDDEIYLWNSYPCKNTYTVTVTNGTGGGEYEKDATVTIKADAAPAGKIFDKWTVTIGNVTLTDANASETTFTMPAEAVTVTATYKEYTLTSGNGQEVEPGSDATFVSDAPFDKFVKVLVDGVEVDEGNYTAEEGSTRVTLKAAFLKTLTPGEYTIEIVSEDGSVSGKFTVIGQLDAIAAINVTLPVPGQTPKFDFGIPTGVNYTAGDCEWYMSDAPITDITGLASATYVNSSHVFQEGKYYTFTAIMFAKDYYVFEDILTATINGESAYYESKVNEQDYQASLWNSYLCTSGYTVTYVLTGLEHNNTATTVDSTADFEDWLYPTDSTHYTIPASITVTVGGQTLTPGTDYTYDDGDIEIPAEEITGDIVITAAAVPVDYSISVEPERIDFGTEVVGYIAAPAAQTITITNTGNVEMQVDIPEEIENFVLTTPDSIILLEPGESVTIQVQPKTGLPVGSYLQTLTIVSGARMVMSLAEEIPTTGSASVELVFEVVEQAPEEIYDFTVTPKTLDFGSATVGYTAAPAAQTVTVTNTGNKQLTLTAIFDSEKFVMVGDAVLFLKPGESTTLTVQPKTGLAVGTHTAEVTVEAVESIGEPETVKATFKVNAKPASNPDVPETGDETRLGLWLGMMLLAVCGIAAVWFMPTKKKGRYSR